jgi:two-component system, OmpR family, phosphate regulon sensor histidine kinase PhoR
MSDAPDPTGSEGTLSRGASHRPAALRSGLAVALTLLGVAAAKGVADLWMIVAAAAAVAVGVVLSPGETRPSRAGSAAARENRLAAADTLLANIPDPVILVDRRVVVREANEAARALLPMLKVGHPLSFALRAPDVLDGIDEALKSGQPLKVEYGQRVPLERTFEVQIGALKPAADDTGSQSGVVLFFRDLTTARRLETMRVDFIANVSHELRTPLASLLGFIETLQGSARADPAARERFLEIMRGQAERMARLIDDLLSLSRIELRAHVQPETSVDLVPIVRQMVDTLAPLARERGVEIVLEGASEPHVVRGDRDELLRVAENLIENGIKYGGSGGRVDVILARRPPAPAQLSQIELSVRDHGPGIAPDHLPRLTERFYRVDVAESRQKGGTGLGLAIVKHIVYRHRGRVTIESELGHGATFRVAIPAYAEAETAASEEKNANAGL